MNQRVRLYRLVLAVLTFQAACPSTWSADLDSLKQTYETEVQKIQAEHETNLAGLLDGYGRSLDGVIGALRKKGDPDPVLTANAEKMRFKRDRTVPHPPADDLSTVLQILQVRYRENTIKAEAEKGKQFIELTTRYADALDRLMRQLTNENELDLALNVKQERKRVEFILADVKTDVEALCRVPYLVRFRGYDQNDFDIRERYAIQLNEGDVVRFDDKRNSLGDGGEIKSDFELYELKLSGLPLRPAGFNRLRIWLDGRYYRKNAGGMLRFDFIELVSGKALIWRIGTEDFSSSEFSRTPNALMHIDSDRRVKTIMIPSGERQPSPKGLRPDILDPWYPRECPELHIVF